MSYINLACGLFDLIIKIKMESRILPLVEDSIQTFHKGSLPQSVNAIGRDFCRMHLIGKKL